jgi:rfaE bifunctional protein kinase chain/domain
MTETWTSLDADRLEHLVSVWEGADVLVLGDVMLDRYLWGNVSRISPEAPVPVVEVQRETVRLGGAANVAHNVLSLGGRVRLLGVVGEDLSAALLRSELSDRGVSAEGLLVDRGRPTTLKTRIVARSQHVVRADQENGAELDASLARALTDAAVSALSEASAVVISDYGKGVVTAALLDRLLPEARRRKVPVCVDPKDIHFFAYRGVSVLTPNQHEAAEVLGFKLRSEEDVDRAGRTILERLDAESVLITRGEKGMSLFEPERRTDFPTVAREVFDVTGAGDTVVSAYAAALAGGAEPREAAIIANHAAGIVVGELGTAVPGLDRLRASFRRETG